MKKRLISIFAGLLAVSGTWVGSGSVVWAQTLGMAKSSVGWKEYPYGNYVWDYFTPGGFHFNPLNGAVPQSMNQIANLFQLLMVHILRLTLQFLDFAIHPSQLTTPMVNELSSLLAGGYTVFYQRLLPAAFAIMAIFLVYRFARNHHASMMQIVMMFVLIAGFGVAFYTHFGQMITGITRFDDAASAYVLNVASELGQKATGDPDVTPNIDPALSVVWDDYVVLPWEAGEFGTSSMNLSKFTVSKEEVGQTYQGNDGKTKRIQRGQNWVALMLSTNGGSQGRTDLAKVLYSSHIPRGSFYVNASEDNPQSSPATRLELSLFNWLFPLADWVPVIFLAVMGGILFATTFGFLLVVIEAAAVLPLTIIPDYGWNKFIQLFKRSVGLLIQKTLNALYLGLMLFVMNLLSVALSGSTASQELGMIIISAVLILGLFFRGRFLRELTSRMPEEFRWKWQDRIRDMRRDVRQQTDPVRRLKRKWDRGHNRNHSKDDDDSSGGGSHRGRRSGTLQNRYSGRKMDGAGNNRASVSRQSGGTPGTSHQPATTGKTPQTSKLGTAAMKRWTGPLPNELSLQRLYQGPSKKYRVLKPDGARAVTSNVNGTRSTDRRSSNGLQTEKSARTPGGKATILHRSQYPETVPPPKFIRARRVYRERGQRYTLLAAERAIQAKQERKRNLRQSSQPPSGRRDGAAQVTRQGRDRVQRAPTFTAHPPHQRQDESSPRKERTSACPSVATRKAEIHRAAAASSKRPRQETKTAPAFSRSRSLQQKWR